MTINVRAAEGVTLGYVRKNEILNGLPCPGITDFGDSVGAVVTLDNPVQFIYRMGENATSIIAEITCGVGVVAKVCVANIDGQFILHVDSEKTSVLTKQDVGNSSFFRVFEEVSDDKN